MEPAVVARRIPVMLRLPDSITRGLVAPQLADWIQVEALVPRGRAGGSSAEMSSSCEEGIGAV